MNKSSHASEVLGIGNSGALTAVDKGLLEVTFVAAVFPTV